jgi:hypothetical protein
MNPKVEYKLFIEKNIILNKYVKRRYQTHLK